MISMNPTEVICLFVEQMLPRGSGNKILQIVLEITATRFDGEEIRRPGMFLFHRPGNYTKVMWRVPHELQCIPRQFVLWPVVANHDSAWRYDGIGSTLMNLEHEMRQKLGSVNATDCQVTAGFAFSFPHIDDVHEIEYNNNQATIEW